MDPEYLERRGLRQSSNSAVAEAPPINETVDNIPSLFDKCGENTYRQNFYGDNIESRKFANMMRAICLDAVEITESNAVVRMHIL